MFFAYTNPEYICLDELNNEINNYCNLNIVGNKKLPPAKPPASPPKQPPQIPTRLHSTKKQQPQVHLYQNVFLTKQQDVEHTSDDLSRQITINCNFNNNTNFIQTSSSLNRFEFLLRPSENHNNRNSLFNKSLSSTTTLSSTDSSSNATMIIRKSPIHMMDYYTPIINNTNNHNDSSNELLETLVSPCSIPPPPQSFRFNSNQKISSHRFSLENDLLFINRDDQKQKNNNRRSEPPLFNKLSPIMTSSRADLNNINDELDKFNSLPSNLTNRQRKLSNINEDCAQEFANLNYYLIEPRPQNELEPPCKEMINLVEEDDHHSNINNIKEDSINSSLSSLVLLPPSPFKSDPPLTNNYNINNNNNNNDDKNLPIINQTATKKIKKVSFMINNDLVVNDINNKDSFNLSNSSSNSMSTNSTTSNEEDGHCERDNLNDLELIQEKIFSKIFANEDYFINNQNHIKVSTSCSSSTSSTSSGYKSSNQSCSIINTTTNNKMMLNNLPSIISSISSASSSTSSSSSSPQPIIIKPVTELDTFIETNRDRLDRLKHKRMQLLNLNSLKIKLNSNEDDFAPAAKFIVEAGSVSSSGSSSCSIHTTDEENNLVIKNESAKLFQKLYKLSHDSPIFRSPKVGNMSLQTKSNNIVVATPKFNSLTRSIK